MGKETISSNDITVINYSVHSNNQNEYMQAYRHSRPSACVVFQDSIMHLITIHQGPALPNKFLAQKYMIIQKTIINSSPMYPYDTKFASFPHLFASFPLFLRSFRIFPHLFANNPLFAIYI